MTSQTEARVPEKMQAKYDEITTLTDATCAEHLNDEYAQLCRKLAAKLSRKRPSPLERGRVKTWAAAIVYTIGQINFLFDKSQTPHIRAVDLCELMGVGKSTMENMAKQIHSMLNINRMDFHWMLPSRTGKSPIVWLISVNGLTVDVRTMPREVQEEAYRKGLIPYLPE